MAEDERDTHPMSFDEKLRAVWVAINSLSELMQKQAEENQILRLRVQKLEAFVEGLPTQPIDPE